MRISSGHLRRFIVPWTPATLADRLLRAFVFFFFRLLLPLRYRGLQRNLPLFNRRLRENHAVITQQMIWMHFVASYQFQSLNVARAQSQVAVFVLRLFDNQ